MADASFEVYGSLTLYRRLQDMIDDGETEGLHIECKSPSVPRLNREHKVHLAKALSGFSNTAGGIVIWGVSTTKHSHSGLDVLSQIEPLGNVRQFEKQITSAIPTLTTPSVINFQTKILRRRSSDTRGVVVVHIPKSYGDPCQSNQDNLFYFRSGDEFSIAPYEMVKRLFSATDSPDLSPLFDTDFVNHQDDGSFEIPILIQNNSSAVGENIYVSVIIENADDCERISASGMSYTPSTTPGKRAYMKDISHVLHRGLNLWVDRIKITMKSGKRRKRRLDITIRLFANRMVAKEFRYAVSLTKKNFSVRCLNECTLY